MAKSTCIHSGSMSYCHEVSCFVSAFFFSNSGIVSNIPSILGNMIALYKSHLVHKTYVLENNQISQFISLFGSIKLKTGIPKIYCRLDSRPLQ